MCCFTLRDSQITDRITIYLSFSFVCTLKLFCVNCMKLGKSSSLLHFMLGKLQVFLEQHVT